MKAYSMSVQEAQELRAGMEALKERVGELQQEREGVKGQERAKLTREITPLVKKIGQAKAQLEDAPPLPMSLEEAKGHLANTLRPVREGYEEARERFSKDVASEGRIRHAIEWAESVVKAEIEWEWVKPLLEKVEDEEVGLADIRGLYEGMMENLAVEFYHHASNVAHSSSDFHNAVRVAETEQMARMVPGRRAGFPLASFERRLSYTEERVAAWEELQAALTEEALMDAAEVEHEAYEDEMA